MKLDANLVLGRCPHCNVDEPNLGQMHPPIQTHDNANRNPRFWTIYRCARCGGCVLAMAAKPGHDVLAVYPQPQQITGELPDTARSYLKQAMLSRQAPSGAVMLSASAVDAMLKARGLKEGSLSSRIDRAAKNHLITEEMAEWAHDVRLDANDERHSDDDFALKTDADAERCIEFATALAQLLFVLPARVQRGRKAAAEK